MQKTKYSKIKSAKLWVTIWAMIIITYIVIFDKTDFYGIAQLLCSVPVSYVVANVAQKAIYSKHNTKIEEIEK